MPNTEAKKQTPPQVVSDVAGVKALPVRDSHHSLVLDVQAGTVDSYHMRAARRSGAMGARRRRRS